MSKMGTHLLASLGSKGKHGNSLACLRNAGSHSAVTYRITAEQGRVARAKGVGEKANECTKECKSQWRLDEMAPWALNCGSEKGGGDKKGRRRGARRSLQSVPRKILVYFSFLFFTL